MVHPHAVQTADFIVRLSPTSNTNAVILSFLPLVEPKVDKFIIAGMHSSMAALKAAIWRPPVYPGENVIHFFHLSSYAVLFLLWEPSHDNTKCSRAAVDMLSGRDTSSIIILDKLWNMQSNELAMTCPHYNVSHVMELKIWHTVSHEVKTTDFTKWTIFCRQRLNMHFLEGKVLSI